MSTWVNADILHQAGEDCGKRRVRRAGGFPGGPVVKTLHFHCRGHGSNPLVGELRSHMPSGVTKKKAKIKISVSDRLYLRCLEAPGKSIRKTAT